MVLRLVGVLRFSQTCLLGIQSNPSSISTLLERRACAPQPFLPAFHSCPCSLFQACGVDKCDRCDKLGAGFCDVYGW